MATRGLPTKDWTIQFLDLKPLQKVHSYKDDKATRTWQGVHIHPMPNQEDQGRFSYYTDLARPDDAYHHTLEEGMQYCKLIMDHWAQVMKDGPREWAVHNRKTKERIIVSQLVG